ncbi:MAG: Monogalactosyldiacylglycerol synthase [Firmicutes bacterium]|nr:Monogalactosyldiacylglycerol synthase [Bacillota bacterium]
MTEPCKILYISAPIGSGHVRAAKAMGSAISQLDDKIVVDYVDFFNFFSPFIGKTILKSYFAILDIFPQLYGKMYGWGNTSPLALKGQELVSGYLAERIHRYIKQTKPDAIVCTHATPAGLTAHLIKKVGLTIPVFGVVTDFTVHRLWVYPELTRYFVANEKMRDVLAHHGVSYEQSQALGIPVDLKFSVPYTKESLRTSFNLQPDCKTVLVMGGGAGVMPMTEIIKTCDQVGIPLQVIAVAGNNKSLYRQLEKLKMRLKHCDLKLYGYVDNIHELMAVADLLISKPGGMTSAEALCAGLPMLIYRPIPGQEEANTRYLVDKSAALRAGSLAQIKAAMIHLLVDNPSELEYIGKCAMGEGRPTAAPNIAENILETLKNGKSN